LIGSGGSPEVLLRRGEARGGAPAGGLCAPPRVLEHRARSPPGTPWRRHCISHSTRQGSSRGAVQYPPSQQVKLRAPVHLALHELEPRHLPLGLAVAPFGRECRLHRCPILPQAQGTGCELVEAARLGPCQPRRERRQIAIAAEGWRVYVKWRGGLSGGADDRGAAWRGGPQWRRYDGSATRKRPWLSSCARGRPPRWSPRRPSAPWTS